MLTLRARALARLNEALATELQDLKVGLTYHSVAVLARLGILVPVIDGFDELLGISGYDDAFSSLAGFLEQLEGRGQLLASARSVYYEEEFVSRADGTSAEGAPPWTHVPVRVLEWSDEDREGYVSEWAARRKLSAAELESLRLKVANTFENENRALALKPLFFTRVVELLHGDPSFSGGDDLLRALVSHYLARERREKLLDQEGNYLLTESQLDRLMSELAEEMWNLETRELDSRSVRDVAEYFVENEPLSDIAKRVIVERMPTLAFLSQNNAATTSRGISFEHEMFFFYFLAAAIVSHVRSAKADMRLILSRSALSEDIADRVANGATVSGARNPLEGLRILLDRLSKAGVMEWRRTTQVRENAGLVIMALLRRYCGEQKKSRTVDGCTVQSVIFPGSDLRNVTFRQCKLVDVTMRRTDLSTTRFIDCDAENVMLFEPCISIEHTRLELKGIVTEQVTGIRVLRGSTADVSYDPYVIGQALRDCGVVMPKGGFNTARRVSQEYRELLERLIRAYRRSNPVCVGDDNLRNIFRNRRWAKLQQVLVKHDIVRVEPRRTGGRPKDFLRRRFLPAQIMAGMDVRADVDSRIREFWEDLEELSKSA